MAKKKKKLEHDMQTIATFKKFLVLRHDLAIKI